MRIKLKNAEDFNRSLIVKGFSQRQLAKKANVSSPYLSQISTGKRHPGPVIAKRICDALGCEFEDIFFVEVDYKSNQTNSA